MDEVYVFNPEDEEVLVHGNKLKDGTIILDSGEEFVPPEGCKVVFVENFYTSPKISDGLIVKNRTGDKIIVECMYCGFETEFTPSSLIGIGDEYPRSGCTCEECGKNVWKEVGREFEE